jgi:hypothetical protein
VKRLSRSLILFACCLGAVALPGQEDGAGAPPESPGFFRQLFSGDPFSTQGSLGMQMRSYQAWGIPGRQTPLSTTIYGNATIQSYGMQIPLNFLINNLSDNSTPFADGYFQGFLSNQRDRLARIGASPQHSWARLHLGHRYMHFSEYTMSNHNFLGAGAELNPGKLRFAAMGGRLAQAEPQNLSLSRPVLPIFQRLGWGLKAGYGDERNFIDAIVFRAADDPASIPQLQDTLSVVTPQENLVLGLTGRKQLFERLTFDFELARSALTRNVADPEFRSSFFLYNSALFRSRSSSDFRTALQGGLTWRGDAWQAGLRYSRVDPRYRSLGTYFFNDDLENFTLNLNLALLQSKLNINATGGIQRNNIDRSKLSTFTRVIANVNVDYRLDKWGFGGRFNNFDSRVDYFFDPESDTLDVIIVSRDLSAYANHTIRGAGGGTHQFNLIGGLQAVTDDIEDPLASTQARMAFANLSYSYRTSAHWQYTLGTDFNRNSLRGQADNRYGGRAQVQKGLLNNQLQLALGSNYFYTTRRELDLSSHLFNHFFRTAATFQKKHTLNLQLTWMNNIRTLANERSTFDELVGTLGYNTRFGWKPGGGK